MLDGVFDALRGSGAASPWTGIQTAVGSLTRVYAQGVQLALCEFSSYSKQKIALLSLVRLRSCALCL